jgi:hypothetical protein
MSAKVQGADEGGDHREPQHHSWHSRGAVRENDHFFARLLHPAFALQTRIQAVQHTGSEKQRSINEIWHE